MYGMGCILFSVIVGGLVLGLLLCEVVVLVCSYVCVVMESGVDVFVGSGYGLLNYGFVLRVVVK